jgi:hypothetical protein
MLQGWTQAQLSVAAVKRLSQHCHMELGAFLATYIVVLVRLFPLCVTLQRCFDKGEVSVHLQNRHGVFEIVLLCSC